MLNGSVVDHLASQGSLASDPTHALLYAVNAGSNTVSVFSVDGDQLSLRQVVDSGGTFPVSIAVHGDLVYVLNAEDGGSVSGYWVADGRLHPIWGSTRSLGLHHPTDTTQFTHTPGQVAFSPDGSQLIVTTKANAQRHRRLRRQVRRRLSHSPVVNSEPGTVPFAVTFDRAGHLVIGEAGTKRAGHLQPPPRRHRDPARLGGQRTAGTVLGGSGAAILLHRQHARNSTVSEYRAPTVSSPCSDSPAPTREQLTPRPRPMDGSSTSRPVERASSTSFRSTPMAP